MNKILFIDILSTGMSPDNCGIYRIGGIYTEDGVEKKVIDLKMCPPINARISQQSLWIGGESRSSLISYPDEKRVFARFCEWLDTIVSVRKADDKLYLAGYNSAAFDMPFLREYFNRCGSNDFRNYFHVQCIDIMSISAMALMNERGRMQDFMMDSVAAHLGIHTFPGDKYDCISNARTALDIYRHFIRRFGIDEVKDTSRADDIVKNYE